MHDLERGMPPEMDLKKAKNVDDACLNAIKAGIIKSAHDLSEGALPWRLRSRVWLRRGS